MTKVCYVIGQLNRAGAEKQLYYLVKGLDRSMFSPAVVSLSRGGYWGEALRSLGIQVVEIERKRRGEIRRLSGLTGFFRSMRPHIVHSFLFSANTYGRMAAVLAGVPVVITSERNLPRVGKDKTVFKMITDKVFAPLSDAIVCNSRSAEECLRERYLYDPGRLFTVHNGIEAAEYPLKDRRYVDAAGDIVVGTIGNLYPKKNHRLFLEMAEMVTVQCRDKNVRFLIAGDGPLRKELQSHAVRLGIRGKVEFTGAIDDICRILGAMDVFVLTSSYEGLSNAIMEAMASGLPVVATDVGGNRELIVDGETGFLAPEGDGAALADRVLALAGDRNLMARMGEKGRQRMLNEFPVKKMVSETEKIYRACIAQWKLQKAPRHSERSEAILQ